MGCIYKITNLINNKIYIGQTSTKIERRIDKHLIKANKANPKSFFHQAIRKYGFNNFIVEILENNIFDSSLLKERENYYILQYESYKSEKGYNLTVGGEGESLFLGREKEVINKYLELQNCIKVAEYFNCDRQVIARVLKDNDIKPLCGVGAKKKVLCVELNKEFSSMKECAEYLINNNLINGNDPVLVSKYISLAIRKDHKYKNFKFKKII